MKGTPIGTGGDRATGAHPPNWRAGESEQGSGAGRAVSATRSGMGTAAAEVSFDTGQAACDPF